MAPFRSPAERLGRAALIGFCVLGLLFLLAPIAAIVPLSFNAVGFFTYPMPGVSLRWYAAITGSGPWRHALVNSLLAGAGATVLATAIGGLAAIGASRLRSRWKTLLSCVLISPMIVPGVVTALALFLTYSRLGLAGHRIGIVVAHALLGVPFVVITLTAALAGFDGNLMRAAASLGAPPATAIRRVMVPLLLPALVASALFAFVTSFDEFIVTLFLAGPDQFTLPLQMWTGVHDDVTPAILAAATLFVGASAVMLTAIEVLRRRAERLGVGRRPDARVR
jgi:putative spermidine/putrescine transport system permease protein